MCVLCRGHGKCYLIKAGTDQEVRCGVRVDQVWFQAKGSRLQVHTHASRHPSNPRPHHQHARLMMHSARVFLVCCRLRSRPCRAQSKSRSKRALPHSAKAWLSAAAAAAVALPRPPPPPPLLWCNIHPMTVA